MSEPARGEIRDLLLTAEEGIIEAWNAASQDPEAKEVGLDTATHTILDRIAQVGVFLLENRQHEDLALVVETLTNLFRAAGERRPPSVIVVPLADERQAMRLFEIARRVYLLGAVSVSVKAFTAIRQLVMQQPNQMRVGRFWLRDTVTALARLRRFEKKSLLGPISEYISERPVFYRRFRNNKDQVVSFLCQFDFLQCIVSVTETKDIGACYPNFGGFYNERTEPIVVDLVTHGRSREAVPAIEDKELAQVILELDRLANHEFFDYAAWTAGNWNDRRIPQFLGRFVER